MLHDENPDRGGKKKQNMSYYNGVLNQMIVKARGEILRIFYCKYIDSGPSKIFGLDPSKTKEGNIYICLFSSSKRKISIQRFNHKFITLILSPFIILLGFQPGSSS